MKYIKLFEGHKEFLSWKRKNITLRGINNDSTGSGGAMLGNGLYTAFLSNKSLAKEFGQVVYVLNGIPNNPIKFNSLNEWEIYFGNVICRKYSELKGKKHIDKRDFYEASTIEKELMDMGYDGIIIKGREMVNFKPENIIYFYNDYQLEDYYYRAIENKI